MINWNQKMLRDLLELVAVQEPLNKTLFAEVLKDGFEERPDGVFLKSRLGTDPHALTPDRSAQTSRGDSINDIHITDYLRHASLETQLIQGLVYLRRILHNWSHWQGAKDRILIGVLCKKDPAFCEFPDVTVRFFLKRHGKTLSSPEDLEGLSRDAILEVASDGLSDDWWEKHARDIHQEDPTIDALDLRTIAPESRTTIQCNQNMMRDLIELVAASQPLDPILWEEIVKYGFEERSGGVFLKSELRDPHMFMQDSPDKTSTEECPGGILYRSDMTSLEDSVNHIHMDGYMHHVSTLDPLLIQGFVYLRRILHDWNHWKGAKGRVLIGLLSKNDPAFCELPSVTVRFFLKRPGESYYPSDLEGFALEAMLQVDSDDFSDDWHEQHSRNTHQSTSANALSPPGGG